MEVGRNDLYLDPSLQASSLDFSKAKAATKVSTADVSSNSSLEETDSAVINFGGVSDLVSLASNSPGQAARNDRVESLKTMIANGDYNVNARDIAEDPSFIETIFG